MVDHERTGLLVPPRDEQALAQAIIRLWQDDALRRTLGQNARRKMEQELSAEAVARQTLEVYRLAIADQTQ
jgi:glycosyltransferase involved in cell wall biosynthesis